MTTAITRASVYPAAAARRAPSAATWLLALALPLFPGCGHGDHDQGTTGGGHSHVAPRGGQLVELGDHKGNLEFMLDAATGTVSMWSLDAHAENPVRLAASQLVLDLTAVTVASAARDVSESLELTPVASALTGESAGDSSEYTGRHDVLVGASAFRARLREIQHRGADYRDVAIDFTQPAAGTGVGDSR